MALAEQERNARDGGVAGRAGDPATGSAGSMPDSAALEREAATALAVWLPVVRSIATRSGSSVCVARLLTLTAWYERAITDPSSTDPAPTTGLDALVEVLTIPHSAAVLRELSLAHQAVRVCEELVRLRACIAGDVAPATAREASYRLELSFTVALREFRDSAERAAYGEFSRPEQRPRRIGTPGGP